MTRTESNASTVMDIPHLNPSIMAGFSTLSYSGMAGSRMVMGDGVILGLSDKTMKIAGESRVKPGMELACMVAVPNSDGHLYLVGGQVSSSALDSFEMDFRQVPKATGEQRGALMQGAPGHTYKLLLGSVLTPATTRTN